MFLLVCSLLFSCTKEVGTGGTSAIVGKVYGYDINSNGIVKDSGYVGDYKVYISYGDHEWIDDDATTSPSGYYQFDELQKGDYTLTVYSQCNSCIFNKEYFSKSVSITKEGETITMEDFVIKD